MQIMARGDDLCQVRARGFQGDVPTDHLMEAPLLEVYFIDVGQGDGVLVRTPDRRHLLVDGGLERTKQHTGKNAADFVDWKFFKDYGDFRVRLDSLMASHSDNDHYGGLHDLVRQNSFLADRELDCLGVDIVTFHHPGLSRWENRVGAQPVHHDGLGPREVVADDFNYFTRLLGDRADAEASIVNNADTELSSYWKYFVRDVLANSAATTVQRLGVAREDLQGGGLVRSAGGETAGLLGRKAEEREKGDSRILGSGDFVSRTLHESNKVFETRNKIPLEDLVQRVITDASLKKDALKSSRRSAKITEARAIISFLAVNQLGMTAAEVGRELGMTGMGVWKCADRAEKTLDTQRIIAEYLV